MRVLLLQSAPTHAPDGSARVDHFVGVAEALHARGIATDRGLQETPRPSLADGTRLVAVADCLGPRTRHALRLAKELRVPSVLLMDGLVEYRNTFENERAGPAFLRPAPAHAIACAGEICANVLTDLGNNPWATGLPRLDRVSPRTANGDGTVIVATANTPWFSEIERERVMSALRTIRETADARGLRVAWRLTGRAELELGVENDDRPLDRLLEGASAVLTTPSTLLAEALLSGVPAGVIGAFETPIWHAGDGIWDAACDNAQETLPSFLAGLAGNGHPMPRDLTTHGLTHPSDGRSAERVAALIADLVHEPPHEDAPVLMPLTRPNPKPTRTPGRPRVVNVVWTDGPPNGGVPVWCERMADRFAAGDLGYDVRTLYLTPISFRSENTRADVCVIPPDEDHAARFKTAFDALLALDPDVVCAHYGDLPHQIATGARFRGIRSIAVLQTDDPSSVDTVRCFDAFDGAVGVSHDCAERLRPIADGRPIRTIHDGVPLSIAPRAVGTGLLRIAYFGRMVELQKRISDLGLLAQELDREQVACELHLVGDGPQLNALLESIRDAQLRSVHVRAHGFRPASWVEAFLPTVDLSVLVSDFEGASITMMEAMGAGVVPCVTDVGSGVRELIKDGTSGIMVPIGDMPAMASRIRDADQDRATLASLGSCAWQRAARLASVEQTCHQWRVMLDEVMAFDPVTAPTDAHLRPRDGYRWTKHWADDEPGALGIITDQLRQAGYARVVPCEPGEDPDPRADAVVLVGPVTPERAELADRLRSDGIGVAFSPTMIEPEWCRLARAVGRAQRRGASRVAVYGAGDHTRRASRAFGIGLPIVGIIDDHPRDDTMLGVPVVRLEATIELLRPDAIVLSSDAWEPALWAKSEPLRNAGLEVIPLYGTYEPNASAPS